MRWRVVCALLRGDADLLADQRIEQRATCRRWAGRRWPPGRSAASRRSARCSGRESRGRRSRRSSGMGHGSSQRAAGLVAGLERVEHAARRFLLGHAARRPSPFGQSQRRHGAFDLEGLRMRLAARGGDAVGRHRQRAAPAATPAARSWRPWSSCRARWSAMTSPNRRCTSACAGVETAVEKGGADDAPRARRRGSTARCAPPPRASPSHRRSTSGRPSASATRCRLSSRTRWARTRVRSPSSEPAKRSNSRPRDGQAEHRVAEKFEPLVVVGAEAAVRQRTRSAARRRRSGGRGVAAERRSVTTSSRQRGRRAAYLERPSYLISRYTGLDQIASPCCRRS